MTAEDNIPESVRENIKKMLDEATVGIPMSDVIKHMQTQICFVMYQTGWRDGFRAIQKSIDIMKNIFGEVK